MGSNISKDNNTSKLYNSNNESYHEYEYEIKSKSLLQEFLNKNQSTNIQIETA